MAPLPSPASPTVAAIFAAYDADAETGYRTHLGASLIGTECTRAIWYSFRWVTRARHTGRILRLFQTGHLAEPRFVADLRRIGVTVLAVDPDTGGQWTLRDAGGHFGGSMDAVAIGLGEASQAYEVDIRNAGDTATLRTITAATPIASYTAAQQTTDGLTPGNPVVLRVFQISATVGSGIQRSTTV